MCDCWSAALFASYEALAHAWNIPSVSFLIGTMSYPEFLGITLKKSTMYLSGTEGTPAWVGAVRKKFRILSIKIGLKCISQSGLKCFCKP